MYISCSFALDIIFMPNACLLRSTPVVRLIQLPMFCMLYVVFPSWVSRSYRYAPPPSPQVFLLNEFLQVRSGFGEWKIAFGSALPTWPNISLAIWAAVSLPYRHPALTITDGFMTLDCCSGLRGRSHHASSAIQERTEYDRVWGW